MHKHGASVSSPPEAKDMKGANNPLSSLTDQLTVAHLSTRVTLLQWCFGSRTVRLMMSTYRESGFNGILAGGNLGSGEFDAMSWCSSGR